MGIYWYVVNHDKKEYISLGKKFGDWMTSDDPKAIFWLLAEDAYPMVMTREEYRRFMSDDLKESEEVLNEVKKKFKYLGRWAGDRIIAIPDYDEYNEIFIKYKNITLDVIREIVKALKIWQEKWPKEDDSDIYYHRELERIIKNFNTWIKTIEWSKKTSDIKSEDF